jgi:phenol 2-monooxygenase (NADPH)
MSVFPAHPEQIGQGMNVSMNDAHNLGVYSVLMMLIRLLTPPLTTAWKLAYVLRGWAGISLLKTVCVFSAILKQ